MMNYICSYNEWDIIERNGKLYMTDEDEIAEVVEVYRVVVTTETEEELFDGAFTPVDFDVCGELDNEPNIYCYWKIVR